jgi:hypothetical protein
MYIECTNGAPIVGTPDHLPPLPLFVNYVHTRRSITILTEQDELGICQALRLHDRIRYIHLNLPPSIFLKVLVLMDEYFPILEHLSLSLAAENSTALPLPKAFLAPNLCHLTLIGISPPKRLRLLTSTVSLVRLELSDIQASSYFRPRVLVARLSSLPQLKILYIEFSAPIPRPSTEVELLGEQGTPVTLPGLKYFRFKGVSAYLELLVAQIMAPLLGQLDITLFNQIAFALPHLSHLVNITEGFKPHVAFVDFNSDNVSVSVIHHTDNSARSDEIFVLRVMCKQFDWQIDCAAQIYNALSPALSGVERLTLECHYLEIPTEWQNGAIDSTTWHELLRSFAEVKELQIDDGLLEELSRALQVDEVGLDPGFLRDLQSINAADNLFTSFIDNRRVVGRPVEFSSW